MNAPHSSDSIVEPSFELRVLTGVHAGARASVQQQFVIGAHSDCDIVLSDLGVAGRHAEIRLEGDRWTVIPLHPIAGTPPEGLELSCGARIALGRVLISLDAANAPWRDASAEEILHAGGDSQNNQCLEIDESATTVHRDSEAAINKLATANVEFANKVGGAKSANSNLPGIYDRIWPVKLTWLAVTLVITLSLAAIGMRVSLETGARIGDSTGPNPSRNPDITTVERDDIARIRAILAQPLEGSTISVDILRNGTALIKGFVRDDDQYTALANALSQVRPRPGMRVYNEAEIAGQVQAWSAEHRKDGWVLSYQGTGHFSLTGSARNESQRGEIMQTVREEFPMLVSLDDRVRLFPVLISELEGKLRAAGIQNIAMKSLDEQMELNISRLTPTQSRLLEDLMVTLFRETNGRLRFRVRAEMNSPPATNPGARSSLNLQASSADLPFQIRSIAGGPAASVRLADGRIIMLGGKVGSYTLTHVDPTEITFDGPTRLLIQR